MFKDHGKYIQHGKQYISKDQINAFNYDDSLDQLTIHVEDIGNFEFHVNEEQFSEFQKMVLRKGGRPKKGKCKNKK